MKALKRLIFIAVAAICTVGLSGCTLIKAIIEDIDYRQVVSDYKSETGISADSLMAVRDKIRAFNIAIDTQYFIQTGWLSRTAGTGLGSGVVFDEDETYYYALTNNHVITEVVDGVKYRTTYTVTDIYGTEYRGASVVMRDGEDNDIAIVKFAKKEGAKYTLPKANYTARKDTNFVVDEFVLAVGNPSGVNNIVTYGEVIGPSKIGNVSYSVLHHNALINPGNSGGALCDIDGNLLGLNTWGSEDSDDDNYCVTLKQINEFIDLFHQSQSESEAA